MPPAARWQNTSWLDNKLQPAEALIALKNMTDQNIPFIMHCTGSMSAPR